MKYVIVGTAGHIDHGKTSLVKAITGIDTDRLPEEKRRGITIDLGFAHHRLADDLAVSFVDVPGHEKLVKTMIAGACGIDMVLLVVAADEGIMPQTVEHLHICEILGINRGVVALNKADKVDPDTLEIVLDEVKEFLKRTPFRDAPVIPVSARTGEGVDELVKALVDVARRVERKPKSKILRMPIDRVFKVKGFGTVVTGTIFSGSVRVQDTVQIQPGGSLYRVRNIQVRGENVEESRWGTRTALNLQGLEADRVSRGDVVVQPGFFPPTRILDAKIFLLEDAKPLRDMAPVRVHVATAEVVGRIKLLDREVLKPGEGTYCRIHLEEEVVAANTDPVVLRSYSPVLTIGGGVILDALPDTKRIKRSELARRLRLLDGADDVQRLLLFLGWSEGGVEPERLKHKLMDPAAFEEILSGLEAKGEVIRLGDRVVDRRGLDGLLQKLKKLVEEAASERGYDLLSYAELSHKLRLSEAAVRDLVKLSGLKYGSKGVQLSDGLEDEAVKRVERIYRMSGFTPPTIDEAFAKAGVPQGERRKILRYLLDKGILVRVNLELALHSKYAREMIKKVEEFFEGKGELTVSEFKNMFGITRKYAIPYLEFLDRVGVTKRRGNVRVKR